METTGFCMKDVFFSFLLFLYSKQFGVRVEVQDCGFAFV